MTDQELFDKLRHIEKSTRVFVLDGELVHDEALEAHSKRIAKAWRKTH